MSFEDLYNTSIKKLDDYIESQSTETQRRVAVNRKKYVETNKNYFGHECSNGRELYICKGCGSLVVPVIGSKDLSYKRQLEQKTCFYCDHWSQISKRTDSKRLIIEGDLYGDGGNTTVTPYTRTSHLGFSGRVFKIRQGNKIWETNNLWHGGTVPFEFRNVLPDNAKFVHRG